MERAGGRGARRRPRVVFVNRYYAPDLSATSQMLTGIAEALAARGLRVEVICSRQSYEDPRAGFGRLDLRQGVTVRRVATTRFGRVGLLGRAVDYLSFYVTAALALLRLVRRGDVIAYVGATGEATGPHLHYQLMLDGRTIDPEPYLNGIPQRVLATLPPPGRVQ